jgi:IS30 family transposase
MAAAVRLRDEGLSLRQIAERLACSHDTVWRDLARWDAARSNVSDLPVRKSPRRGQFLTAESDSEPANVVAINDRRKQA